MSLIQIVEWGGMYSSEAGLFDTFQLHGKWWLPSSPQDRVHGTLSYTPSQRIELRLDGKFQDPRLQNIFLLQPFTSECILGETVEEEFVTLRDVFASRVSRTDTFIASALIIGERFSSASDCVVVGALLEYTNLEEWASIHPVKMEKGENPDFYRVDVPTISRTLFAVKHTAPFKELRLTAGVYSSSIGTTFSAQSRALFDCDFQRPVLLRDVEPIFMQLGNLLSILQGAGVYLKQVRLRIGTSDDSSRIGNWFRVLRIATPPVLSSSDMTLPFGQLAEHASCLFGSWFGNAKTLDPVYDLLVGTYGAQSERNKFRALTQALEAFHRIVFGGVYATRESYKPIWDSLCAVIPPSLDQEFQERLKSAVRYGYQFSLRTRLKSLFAKLSDKTKEAVVREKRQTFINDTVRVRNYLTHFDETDRPDIVDNVQGIYNLNQRLRALLVVLLLTYLGVPEEVVRDGVVSNLKLAR
jgi:hypothetical protein